jgi:DNA primase
MKIPDQTLAQITERLDMAEVVSEYVHLEKRGDRYWGLCPFHTEKTPSFSVNPEKSLFYCFGCQKGGSLFTFIMEMEKLSFVEAVRWLARKAGVELSLESGDTRRRDAYLELYRRVAGMFHYLLLHRPQAQEARAYLQGRGMTPETLERFQIGYAPASRGWLWGFLLGKKYTPEFLEGTGLFVASRSGRASPAGQLSALFRDRIMFPIVNNRGEVVAFGGRVLSPAAQPKYLNSPETEFFRKRENLFGAPGALQRIREAGSFLLVEGYMDVLAMSQAGVENCVAPLGTAVTEEQLRLLKRYAPSGCLSFDSDDAGVQATQRALLLCERLDLSTEVVEPGRAGGASPAKDAAEILEKEGPEALKKALECRINGFQFYLNAARARYDSRVPDGKRGIIRYLSSFLSSVDSQVKRDGYLRLLAEALGVDFESVRSDLTKEENRNERRLGGLPRSEADGLSAELFFLFAVAINRDYFAWVRNRITLDDLEDPRARALYVALEECYRSGESTQEALLQRLEEPALTTLLLQKTASEEFLINPDQMIRDGLRDIRRRSLERRRSLLEAQLSQRAGADSSAMKELLAEKMYLDEELESLKVGVDDRSSE